MFEEVLYKSEIAVCEAMENCLNKAEQIIEYAGIGDASDEYVMELFDIFMEATDRRKKAERYPPAPMCRSSDPLLPRSCGTTWFCRHR